MNKKKTILKSTIVVTLITLIIKAMGLVRQMVIASYCGASFESDAFFLATGVIVSISTIVFSSITLVLQKSYVNRLTVEGRRSANNLLSSSLKLFVPVGSLIFLLFIFSAPHIARFLAPTFEQYQIEVLTKHIRLLSLAFVLSAYYLIVDVALLTEKRFLPGKIQILLQNVFIIVAAVFFYGNAGIDSLIYAVLLSMIVQCIFVTVAARKVFIPAVQTSSEKKELRSIFLLSLPVLLGNAMFEINDIVDKRIATSLGEGSISYLTYGSSINEMITTLIVSSLATVLFANFSIWFSEGKSDNVQGAFKKSFLYLFALMMPIMVLCFTCSQDIVHILFGRGRFSDNDTIQTSAVIIGYSFGFFFQASRSILSRTYYSFGDTKKPMITGVIIVVTNISLSVVLSNYIGVSGIAVATSISMFIGTIALLPGVKKMLPNYKLADNFIEYLKMFLSAAIVFFIIFFAKKSVLLDSIWNLLIFGFLSIALYSAFLFVFRSKVEKEVVEKIRSLLLKNQKY